MKLLVLLKHLHHFIFYEIMSCIFPISIFIILGISKFITPSFMYRYDFILLLCILVQFLMVYSKLETLDELKVISLFHIIGLFLEIYKVKMGSWSYPEEAWLKIGNVPLYSGFMYSSIASYICQAWKRFDLNFIKWPRNLLTYSLSFFIYINFFTHHYILDIRWYIVASLFIIFRKSYIEFRIKEHVFEISVLLSFFLIGFFIWIAENISTYLGAWKYPNQEEGWKIVHLGKISSWFLLVIISIVIVANLKHLKSKKKC